MSIWPFPQRIASSPGFTPASYSQPKTTVSLDVEFAPKQSRRVNTNEDQASAPATDQARPDTGMSGTPEPSETDYPSEPNLARPVPDVPDCRVRRSSVGNYVECLEDRSLRCADAISFGNDFLCLHPERETMIARTEARLRE